MVAVKQHVPLNRGAFILWKIAPVPVPQCITLAEKHHNAPLSPSLLLKSLSQSLVTGCLESGGIPGMSTISAAIDKFLSSGWGKPHTCAHRRACTRVHTHTLARLCCYCWLVSDPHLWMVTRACGLQCFHSYLTDSRDRFPWAEGASRVEEGHMVHMKYPGRHF